MAIAWSCPAPIASASAAVSLERARPSQQEISRSAGGFRFQNNITGWWKMEKTMRMAVRLALLAALLSLPAEAQLGTAAPVVDISVAAQSPGPIIDRHIYGQFAEHLGRGIYEGIWVGENSKIPNIH